MDESVQHEFADDITGPQALTILVDHSVLDKVDSHKLLARLKRSLADGADAVPSTKELVADLTTVTGLIKVFLDNRMVAHRTKNNLEAFSKEAAIAVASSSPVYQAWLAFGTAAKRALDRSSLQPTTTIVADDKVTTLEIYTVTNNKKNAYLAIITSPDRCLISCLATTTSTALYVDYLPAVYATIDQYTLLYHGATIISSAGLIVEKKSFPQFNLFDRPKLLQFAGKFGASPFATAQNNLLLVEGSFEAICSSYDAVVSNNLAFIEFYKTAAERIGFLLEAKNNWATLFYDDAQMLTSTNELLIEDNATELYEEADELTAEIAELIAQEEQCIKDLQAKKKIAKQTTTKRGRGGRHGARGGHANTTAPIATITTLQEATATINAQINQGRMKFRKIKPLINDIVKAAKINCRQVGSHIVLERDGFSPITVVKQHKRDKSLSIGEVNNLLDSIQTLASQK